MSNEMPWSTKGPSMTMLKSIAIFENVGTTFRVLGRQICGDQVATRRPIRWWFTTLDGQGLLIDDQEVVDPFSTNNIFLEK